MGVRRTNRMSYLQIYVEELIPRLRAIDLRLKSGEKIGACEAVDLLGITYDELLRLRGGAGDGVAADEFLWLMRHGSSDICGMYRRELELKSPSIYTAEDIAYIYGIEPALVCMAFNKLNAAAVTEYMLPDVFAEIWI